MKQFNLVILVMIMVSLSLSCCSDNKHSASLNYTDTFYIDGDICGAFTEEDLDRAVRYITRNDKMGFNNLRNSGSLVDLASGTEIKIIKLGVLNSKIRTNDNVELWVVNDFITNIRKTSTKAKYHNETTGERQTQYSGSKEQQKDLDAIDEYAKNHPEFW